MATLFDCRIEELGWQPRPDPPRP